MKKAVDHTLHEFSVDPHRQGHAGDGRRRHGRGLWQPDAPQGMRRHHDSRCAPDPDPAVGRRPDQGHREGDPDREPGLQSDRRRQDRAHSAAGHEPRAPPGIRQDRLAWPRRAGCTCATSGATRSRPSRRPSCPRTRASAWRRTSRPRPTRRSRTSTTTSPHKEKELLGSVSGGGMLTPETPDGSSSSSAPACSRPGSAGSTAARIAASARRSPGSGGGAEVLVVSSGAIGLGMGGSGLTGARRTAKKQACAAVGQSLLMETWQAGFAPHGITVAQVLLTHEDLRIRAATSGQGDAAAGDRLRRRPDHQRERHGQRRRDQGFGDNDTLSAMVASLVEADYLLILSTAPG
jgi:hypothetical protein